MKKAIKQHEPTYVGVGIDVYTQAKKRVVNGNFVFKLMDSKGLPLDIILVELREKSLAFDLIGFIEAAIKSKNYSKKKLRSLIESNRPKNDKDFMSHVDALLSRCFD